MFVHLMEGLSEEFPPLGPPPDDPKALSGGDVVRPLIPLGIPRRGEASHDL